MKAENLMVKSAPSPKSAGSALRSAVKTQTAAQSAKAENKNDFGSALDSAKNSKKDAQMETREAGKQEAADVKQPDAAETKQTDTSTAAEAKNADARENGAAEVDEKAAEAADGLPKSRKKDKTAKTEEGGNAETVEVKPATEDAATTLNAMLMAMAGNAQAGAAQTDTAQPEAAPTETAELPMEEQPIFAAGALDSLLPQDAAKEQQAAQNQKLMDMLSGNGADLRLTDEQMKSLTPKVQEVAAAPDTEVLQQPVQVDTQTLPQTQQVQQTAEPAAVNSEVIAEQPEAAAILQTETVPVQTRTVAQENRTETRGEKPQSLFAGVPLTVEDAVLDKAQTVSSRVSCFVPACFSMSMQTFLAIFTANASGH